MIVKVENYNLISEEEYNDIESQFWCESGEACWETNAKKLIVAVLGDGSGVGRVFAWNTSYSKWDNMQCVCLKNGGNILWNC